MSASKTVTEQKPIQSFQYRNIKKDFEKPRSFETVTTDFHIELDSDMKTKIVQDRNIDWVELQNKDVDSVGLANILQLARRGQIDLGRCAFKDGEAIDTTLLDPMDPESLKKTLDTQSASAKLKALADSIGLTVEQMVKGVVEGNLGDLIKTEEVKEEVSVNEK